MDLTPYNLIVLELSNNSEISYEAEDAIHV